MSENQHLNRFFLKWHGWMGLAIIGISEVLLFSGGSLVRTFFTPLVWTGYILFMDSVVHRQRGTSWSLDRPKELLLLLPTSTGFWLISEFYNLYLRNWHYVGLPKEVPLRLLGYDWAFATIWPAILITAEALEGWKRIPRAKVRPWKVETHNLALFFDLRGPLSDPPADPVPQLAHQRDHAMRKDFVVEPVSVRIVVHDRTSLPGRG